LAAGDPAALSRAHVDPLRRHRRPSGAPPPLPRSIGNTGVGWLVALAVVVVANLAGRSSGRAQRTMERLDSAVLRGFAELRTDWLVDIARHIDHVCSGWTLFVLGVGLMVALAIFKRWRHLFTFVGAVFMFKFAGAAFYEAMHRPRPFDVTIIGRWGGFSSLSPPVAVLTSVAVGVVYAMVVPGQPRSIAKAIAGAVIAIYAGSRLYLGVDHPSDVISGVVFAVATLVVAFRWFTPNEVYPVQYRRGKTAHLDVTGARGVAIKTAMRDQLGVEVLEVKPVGLEGSGGSTPLRIQVSADPQTYLFGKLYAMSHVRADRWYKIGRTILYGRLEDETPFNSVRRLIEYEDYALRLLRDLGVPTAAPGGVVEITPEREYLFLTEFVDGGKEIGDPAVEVTDDIVDQGLALVRQLWDAGIAHRDIKPANLLVQQGRLILIDDAFVQVRPSPWRQAVDLANMMLVLGLRTDADRVYQRALSYFTPDEIAEAFAAARGVASPTQLRTMLKSDGRDLVEQFRALAPNRRPIRLQRWSVKRVLLAVALLVGTILGVSAVAGFFTPTHDIPVAGTPLCRTDNLMILVAQSVPDSTKVPCISNFPAGWVLGGVRVKRDETRFWLDSDVAGSRALQATLLPEGRCDTTGATEVPSDEDGARRFERPAQLRPRLDVTRFYLVPGGCIVYHFDFDEGTTAATLFAADSALGLQPREPLVDDVSRRTDLRLCGASAPECPGGT